MRLEYVAVAVLSVLLGSDLAAAQERSGGAAGKRKPKVGTMADTGDNARKGKAPPEPGLMSAAIDASRLARNRSTSAGANAGLRTTSANKSRVPGRLELGDAPIR